MCVCMCCDKIRNFNIVYILSILWSSNNIRDTNWIKLFGFSFFIWFYFILFVHSFGFFQTHLKLYSIHFPILSINARTINFQIYQQTTKSIPKQNSFTLPSCAWKLKSLKIHKKKYPSSQKRHNLYCICVVVCVCACVYCWKTNKFRYILYQFIH